MTIFKTWKKATYFTGKFKLRDQNDNWASPIDFPTIFTAYGMAIKSGKWQSCTGIGTPDYVINDYFDGIGKNRHDKMYNMWEFCKELDNITWDDVTKDKDNVLRLINLANNELLKLEKLN